MLKILQRLSNNAHESELEQIYNIFGWDRVGVEIHKLKNTDGLGRIRGTNILCLQEVKKKVPMTFTKCNEILSQILAYKSCIENGLIKDDEFFINPLNSKNIKLYFICTRTYFCIIPENEISDLYETFNHEYKSRYVCPSNVWKDPYYKSMFINYNYGFKPLEPTIQNLKRALRDAVSEIEEISNRN